GWTRRALDRLAVVAQVGNLNLGGDAFDLILGQAELHQVAIIEQVQRMAGRADFLVDLEAALSRGAVVGTERALEVPVLVLELGLRFGGDGDGAGRESGERNGARDEQLAHGAYTT